MSFYPAPLRVPEEKRTDLVLLRPLGTTDVDLDYDAVMSTAEALRRWSQSTWPEDAFTLAENLADLERHEREHRERAAFTFTVMSPDESRCLGCVYIEPLSRPGIPVPAGAARPANVRFWVRTSEHARDLDRHLLATLREWLQTEWAFDALVFAVAPDDARLAGILEGAGLRSGETATAASGRRWVAFR